VAITAQIQGVPWWGLQDTSLLSVTLPGGFNPGFMTPPSQWDVVRVGPNYYPLPGLVKVRRCSRGMKLHRKEHPSSNYETQTFQGFSVVEFDFDLVMWTDAQLANFQLVLPTIFPGTWVSQGGSSSSSVATVSSTQNIVNPNQSQSAGSVSTQQVQVTPNTPKRPPLPVKIAHPALQIHSVKEVVFTHVDGPLQRSESVPDIFVVHLKCVQFNPSRPTKATTLTQAQTQPTNLGANPVPGIAPQQQPNVPPSASGGADPSDLVQSVNYVSLPPALGF
jgi:hypothetical protein